MLTKKKIIKNTKYNNNNNKKCVDIVFVLGVSKNPPSSLLVCSTADHGPRWPYGIHHAGNV